VYSNIGSRHRDDSLMTALQLLPLAPAQLQNIPGFLGQVISDLLLLIPRLIGALIILLIGWFIGRAVARVVSTVADRTEIDRRTLKTPIGDMLGGTEQAVSNALGKVAAYYIYFLAILAAADALQIPLLSAFIADAAAYLPAFIAGLLIIVVGFIVADFVGNAIERSASATGSGVGSMLASGVQVFLYFIVIVVGLDTMQIDVGILYIFASAVAGGLGLALAIGLGIALGLGGRDYVANNIDDWAGRASNEMESESSETRPETRGSGMNPEPDIND
jgi:hypothetical protein